VRHEEYMKQAAKDMDEVNHPPHYNKQGVECIHAIEAATDDGYQYYLQGNIIKYLWRYRYKGKPIEDLQKARWYLDRLIGIMENGNKESKS